MYQDKMNGKKQSFFLIEVNQSINPIPTTSGTAVGSRDGQKPLRMTEALDVI
jgi:hypothetical protein